MDGKQEGGSFLKQMQNKVKNLRKKLEKIQEKEKRPRSELSEEEKTQLESKPMTELLLSEYEKLLPSYLNAREGPEVPKPEVRVEVREEDNAEEVIRLWATLHFVGLPGAQELYEAQGLPKQDFEEIVAMRKAILGKPGDSVMDLHTAAIDLLAPHIQSKDDACARVSKWCLGQKLPIPPPEPVLAVHSLPQHDIIKETPAIQSPPSLPLPVVDPVPIPSATEEAKTTPTTWADQDDEEESPEAAVLAEQAKETDPQAEEESEFTLVGGKPKRKKAPEPDRRGGFGGRRRGNFRGDRRPRGRGGERGQ